MGIFKKHGNWYIDYYVDGKRKREVIGPNYKLAVEVLHKRKTEIAEGKYLNKKIPPKILFKDFGELYYNTYSLPTKKSFRSDALSLKRLNEFFGANHLHQITPFMIEQYRAIRKAKVSPRTVNIEFQALRHIYNKAIEWGYVTENPASKIKKFKENSGRTRYLTQEELNRLLEVSNERVSSIVKVAVNTGMRRGELKNLCWKDINFEKGYISIIQSKSGKPRFIPINNIVHDTFIKLKSISTSEKVFDFTNFRRDFDKAVKKAGLENFKFHDLRHTFASHLVMAGINLKTVQELLGHSSYRMTERYTHLAPNEKVIAVNLLGSRWTLYGHQESGITNSTLKQEENVLEYNELKNTERWPSG